MDTAIVITNGPGWTPSSGNLLQTLCSGNLTNGQGFGTYEVQGTATDFANLEKDARVIHVIGLGAANVHNHYTAGQMATPTGPPNARV